MVAAGIVVESGVGIAIVVVVEIVVAIGIMVWIGIGVGIGVGFVVGVGVGIGIEVGIEVVVAIGIGIVGTVSEVFLITGGTGSFGCAFTRHLLGTSEATVRLFSRDEHQQARVRERFGHERVRYLVGDVRDEDRLRRAMHGVTVVVHAAALKRVDTCETNPWETVHTNVIGTQNVIDAAVDTGVGTVVALSTDKSVAPVNLYGASKLTAEKLILHAGVYSSDTRFAVVRYGNVVGSRGSIVPVFREQAARGEPLTVTDARMTRFWVRMEQAVSLVLEAIAKPGAVLVPKAPSVRIVDVAEAFGGTQVLTGIRAGEKLHEVMFTVYESAADMGDHYRIEGACSDGWTYSSDTNTFLDVGEIAASIADTVG